MRLLQINSTVNSGSTGRIAEAIGKVCIANGDESFIAYARGKQSSSSRLVKVGGGKDIFVHGVKSMLFDMHGFGSKRSTHALVEEIERIRPDLIGLHNIHGYYVNVEILFSYLKASKIPVVWTLHDCWPFTGHCAHFDFVGCMKWKDHCEKCPLTTRYPKSLGYDNSRSNFDNKRRIFQGVENLTIVTPSRWLQRNVKQSFLAEYPSKVIQNGVDLDVFTVQQLQGQIDRNEKIVLGVAGTWDRIKGLPDFIKLRSILPERFRIVLIGLSEKQIKSLPKGITGVRRTENVGELVQWYNRALVFANPTYVDNFPTTNLEALACGTPVITYNSGGSPEAVDSDTGYVIQKGDVNGVAHAVEDIAKKGKEFFAWKCRIRAESFFNQKSRFLDYYNLYQTILTSRS